MLQLLSQGQFYNTKSQGLAENKELQHPLLHTTKAQQVQASLDFGVLVHHIILLSALTN